MPRDPTRRSRATDGSSARFVGGWPAGDRRPLRSPSFYRTADAAAITRAAINADGNGAAVSNEDGKRISGKGMGFPFRTHSLARNSLARLLLRRNDSGNAVAGRANRSRAAMGTEPADQQSFSPAPGSADEQLCHQNNSVVTPPKSESF